MAGQQEVIKKFMAALDKTSKSGTAAVDEALSAWSANFKTLKDLTDKIVADCKKAGDAETFLRDYCGIILSNTDTGAITGKDAGGSKILTAESVVAESGALKNFTGNSFTVDGATFKLEKDFTKLNDDEKFIWQAFYTWWSRKSLTLIKESYGYSFSDSDVSVKDITFKFESDDSTSWIAWSSYRDRNSDGKMDTISLTVNMDAFGGIDKTNFNGKGSGTSFYLDRTLAHELVHQIMYAKVDYEYNLPAFIGEGLGELLHGIDDERPNDLKKLAGNSSLLEQALSTSTKSPKVSGVASPSYAGGYIFFRYLAKQSGVEIKNLNSKASVVGSENADTIENYGAYSTISALGGNDFIGSYRSQSSINAGAGNDTVQNTSYGTFVTITGGAGNDSIRNSANAKIFGGAGNDTLTNTNLGSNSTLSGEAGNDYITTYNADNISISGGAGNDRIELRGTGKNITVAGGAGNDTISISGGSALIQYSAGDGKDSVVGFNENSTLSIAGSYYSSQTSGKNILVTVDDSVITLVGAASLSKVNISGSKGLLVTNTTKSPVTVDSTTKIINASNRTTAINITGNKLANSIVGGSASDNLKGAAGNDTLIGNGGKDKLYGGAGNDKLYGGASNDYLSGGAGADSLWGGAGTDKLLGGSGNDVFIYTAGDGTDTILDYESGDMLKILNVDGSNGSFKTSKFSGGDLTLTINGGGKIIFDGVSASDKFNINGTNYKISGSKLVK